MKKREMQGAGRRVYGREFSRVYNDDFAFWGKRVWPFVSKLVSNRVPHARSWLDLCCGTGSLLTHVCQAGYDAVGLDRSRCQLEYARQNAPAAKLVHADVSRFSLGRTFDVVTCMFDSLNYLTRKNDLLGAFRRARRHLDPGGLFIFDVNTFEGLQDTWRQTSARHRPDRTLVLESSFDARRALGRVLITGFVRQGKLYRKFQEEHVERGYRTAEIDDLLARAGLLFRKYDGHDFRRPRKRSSRILYVCRHAGPGR